MLSFAQLSRVGERPGANVPLKGVASMALGVEFVSF